MGRLPRGELANRFPGAPDLSLPVNDWLINVKCLSFANDPSNPYNPGQNTADPASSKAALDRFEEGGAYVRVRGGGLEDQYGASGSHPVQSFSRDLVYVRPGSFVIHDRTQVTSASADQWLAFHVPKAPASTPTTDAGMRRWNVPGSAGTLGSIVSVLPEDVVSSSVALPGGATRIELHAVQPSPV